MVVVVVWVVVVVEYPMACSAELAVEREDSDNRGGGIGRVELGSSYGGGSTTDGLCGSSKVTLLNLAAELFRPEPSSRSLRVDSELLVEAGTEAEPTCFSSRSCPLDRHSRIVPARLRVGVLVEVVVTSLVGEVVMIDGGATGWFVGNGGGFSFERRPSEGSEAFRRRERLNRGDLVRARCTSGDWARSGVAAGLLPALRACRCICSLDRACPSARIASRLRRPRKSVSLFR